MPATILPGLLLSINGKDVTLAPSDVTAAQGSDLHYELLQPVSLGSVGADMTAFVTFLNNTFGLSINFDVQKEIANLPSPLSDMATALANLEFTVQYFRLTVPATKNADGTAKANPAPKTFTFGVTATLAAPVTLVGSLAIKGIYLQVSYDGVTTTTQATGTPS